MHDTPDTQKVPARTELHESPGSAPSDDARIYPCDHCGVMRTKAEGGTVFTVCDKCWDALRDEERKRVASEAGERMADDHISRIVEAMHRE